MWRETKILLIDDDSVRRRDLAVILNFLGEENLPCGSHDWQQAVGSLSSSREVICVLIGTVNAPGALLGLLKTLSTWDEFLPILLMGDNSSIDLPEDQREVFLLRAHGDLELNEIAELTRTPAETVKSRLRYALQKLRRLLATEELSA